MYLCPMQNQLKTLQSLNQLKSEMLLNVFVIVQNKLIPQKSVFMKWKLKKEKKQEKKHKKKKRKRKRSPSLSNVFFFFLLFPFFSVVGLLVEWIDSFFLSSVTFVVFFPELSFLLSPFVHFVFFCFCLFCFFNGYQNRTKGSPCKCKTGTLGLAGAKKMAGVVTAIT